MTLEKTRSHLFQRQYHWWPKRVKSHRKRHLILVKNRKHILCPGDPSNMLPVSIRTIALLAWENLVQRKVSKRLPFCSRLNAAMIKLSGLFFFHSFFFFFLVFFLFSQPICKLQMKLKNPNWVISPKYNLKYKMLRVLCISNHLFSLSDMPFWHNLHLK